MPMRCSPRSPERPDHPCESGTMRHDDFNPNGAPATRATPVARRSLLAAALGGCAVPGSARAAEGITTDSVTFVQTADMSGSRVALVKELNAGAQALLARVN